jgi:hypothetical protein
MADEFLLVHAPALPHHPQDSRAHRTCL